MNEPRRFYESVRRYLAGGELHVADRGDRSGLFAVLRSSAHYEFEATPVDGGAHVVIAGGDSPREFCVELLLTVTGVAPIAPANVGCNVASLRSPRGRTQHWTMSLRSARGLYARALGVQPAASPA